MKMVLVVLLSIVSMNAMAAESIRLECQEKWASFRISGTGNTYTLERTITLDRVRGNPYVSGFIDVQSKGLIEGVVAVEKSEKTLTFKLEDEKFLSFTISIDTDEEDTQITIKSDAQDVEIQLGAILGTKENPLTFMSATSCKIK